MNLNLPLIVCSAKKKKKMCLWKCKSDHAIFCLDFSGSFTAHTEWIPNLSWPTSPLMIWPVVPLLLRLLDYFPSLVALKSSQLPSKLAPDSGSLFLEFPRLKSLLPNIQISSYLMSFLPLPKPSHPRMPFLTAQWKNQASVSFILTHPTLFFFITFSLPDKLQIFLLYLFSRI